MRVIAEYGRDDLAKVYVARIRDDTSSNDDYYIEFVESVQPPLSRERKWVLIVSSMIGCPVKCLMCDAGGDFKGLLTTDEIISQVTYMVNKRYPDGKPLTKKFKIQFARMGEPSFNPAVLDALRVLPSMYDSSILHASLSTVAPAGRVSRLFFNELVKVKEKYYKDGRFQLQFSIHTTDEVKRDELIPVKRWSFKEIAAYGECFSNPEDGDLKVTLNFAPIRGYNIDTRILRDYFNPDYFIIKLTPVNPTIRAHEYSLSSYIDPYDPYSSNTLIEDFKRYGYEVILSIGEVEENQIGSNCGQFIKRVVNTGEAPEGSYNLKRYLN
jgi:23S rRNA (adenine2503-C2)-methyltransferase